jgi:transcription antitermination factor NusG
LLLHANIRSDDEEESMSRDWYVLRSKPRKERSLEHIARANGHEVFYPTIPVEPVNPRAAKIKPYFPGYMFLHTSLAEVGETTFRWLPFSNGLVRLGGEPAKVAEAVVRVIQRRVEHLWQRGPICSHTEKFKHGAPILISRGVFAGYEGIFDLRLSGHERVRVLLKMVHDRYVLTELSADDIEPDDRRTTKH